MVNTVSGKITTKGQYLISAIIVALLVAAYFVVYSAKSNAVKATLHEHTALDRDNAHMAIAPTSNPIVVASTPYRVHEPLEVYNPTATLESQIDKLRTLANRHEPYATCVLAWALDFCSRGSHINPVEEYGNMDLSDQGEKKLSRIAADLAFRDRYEVICPGVNPGEFKDIDERMLQSALMGHTKSMARLALLPNRFGGGLDISRINFAVAYQKSAENMLNRAAEAGDRDALLGIYQAYKRGYIESTMGELKVNEDLVKSTAAARTLSRYAEPDDRKGFEEIIAESLARMSPAQQSRLASLESKYQRAQEKNTTGADALPDGIDDSPEKACAKQARP